MYMCPFFQEMSDAHTSHEHGGVYFVLVLNVIATETFSFSDLEGGVMLFPDKKSFRGDHIEDVC